MKIKCLLIELIDGRKFFTKIKSKLNLIEFSKTFKATLKVVTTENPEILDLKDLATAICNNENKGITNTYTVIETLSSDTKSNGYITEFTNFSDLTKKQKHSSKSNSIFNYIIEKLKNGDKISVKNFAKKMKKHNISSSTIYRFLKQSKKVLKEKDGLDVSKVSPGIYAVISH